MHMHESDGKTCAVSIVDMHPIIVSHIVNYAHCVATYTVHHSLSVLQWSEDEETLTASITQTVKEYVCSVTSFTHFTNYVVEI